MFTIPTMVAAGDLDPLSSPTPTMHTLDEIYQQNDNILNLLGGGPAPVSKTGQTVSYESGDDGDIEAGANIPTPRFVDNGDGTVEDNLTGLIWLKNANCFGPRTWVEALDDCNGLANSSCGLNDGSLAGDWRLPNAKELSSLTDFGNSGPSLPNGHPFTGVESTYYWSSTTYVYDTAIAWYVSMGSGHVTGHGKVDAYYFWPVRGGSTAASTTGSESKYVS